MRADRSISNKFDNKITTHTRLAAAEEEAAAKRLQRAAFKLFILEVAVTAVIVTATTAALVMSVSMIAAYLIN